MDTRAVAALRRRNARLDFADGEAFGVAAASPAFATAVADVANSTDASRLPTAFVEYVVIVG